MNERGRVLIVDDMENWRDLLGSILEDEGYLVQFASTYSEAMNILRNQSPHLAVIDIRLVDADETNVDGLRLLDEIEKRDKGKRMGVIIITGYGVVEHARAALRKCRVLDFIEKRNFDSEGFRGVVRKGIERYSQ